MDNTPGRMSADQRRVAVLNTAADLFARHGYSATTTDHIARAAGISQPYVVRMFGTKEALFIAVVQRSFALLLTEFRAAVTEQSPHPIRARLGDAYVRLATREQVHLPLMQSYLAAADPAVGAAAREGFEQVLHLLIVEAGLDLEDAQAFVAQGMLINTLLALDAGRGFAADQGAPSLMRDLAGRLGLVDMSSQDTSIQGRRRRG